VAVTGDQVVRLSNLASLLLYLESVSAELGRNEGVKKSEMASVLCKSIEGGLRTAVEDLLAVTKEL
jgi:hypothetical protein